MAKHFRVVHKHLFEKVAIIENGHYQARISKEHQAQLINLFASEFKWSKNLVHQQLSKKDKTLILHFEADYLIGLAQFTKVCDKRIRYLRLDYFCADWSRPRTGS